MAWNEPNDSGKDKDPWRKGQQPPDLDQIIRKIQQKFVSLFGGKKVSAGDETPTGGSHSLIVTLIVSVVLIIWALSGIFIVGPAEEAVVLRFGKLVKTVGPGPHWIPRFIERSYVLNVQKIDDFSYTAQMLNKDENIVSVSLAVQYRIGNLKDYLFNVVNPRQSLREATASALRQVVGHTTLDEVLTVGREKLRQQVTEQLNNILSLYNTGLIVTDVTIQPAKAPDEVRAAFDDAIKAQEEEQRFINQAIAYTRRVIPIAEGQAKRILQEADAYKQQVILHAEGDVARFLALLPEYKRAPKVTKERLYLATMESVMQHTRKVLVDVAGSNNMFYLPLDRMMGGRLVDADEAKAEPETSYVKRPSEALSQVTNRGMRAGRETYRGRGEY